MTSSTGYQRFGDDVDAIADYQMVRDLSRASRVSVSREEGDAPLGNVGTLMTILKHPFSVLLVCVPLGAASAILQWSDSLTFWINFVAMVPLAKILGDFTEELAATIKNDTLSGLLNATFGNAVEMIITINTLRWGLLKVVKATLLGSVLSNMLLVLGSAFFLGGLTKPSGGAMQNINVSMIQMSRHQSTDGSQQQQWLAMEKEQKFGSKGALVSMTMLLVACMSMALPTVFSGASGTDHVAADEVVSISRACSIITLVAYLAYLVFQLVTHPKTLAKDQGQADDEDGGMTMCFSIGGLAVAAGIVAVSSEFLVGAIEGVVKGSGLGEHFIGIVLLPIVGNACEHAAAIRFAMQDQPGLAVGIAVGSSTQIAMFVVPFAVVSGWIIGQPMDLNFGAVNVTVLIISVLIVLSIVLNGRTNWLEGWMLISAYAIVSVLYWYLPNSAE